MRNTPHTTAHENKDSKKKKKKHWNAIKWTENLNSSRRLDNCD